MPALATPQAAQNWLAAWAGIGGGVTISREGHVCPWRGTFPNATQQERLAAQFRQRDLLRQLDRSPELAAAVRVIVSTGARQAASRAVAAMGVAG